MDTESDRIYDRMTLYRLMNQHPSWTTAQLAKSVGRTKRWGRKWFRRFKDNEVKTFKMFQSNSRAPKTRPRQTPEAVKDAICQLRQTLSEQYHRPAGARLIRYYLLKDLHLK